MSWSAVSKKARVVVAADPDSLSGIARKALDYVPIIDESTLGRLLADAGPMVLRVG